MIVAVDGPAAAGKGTIARRLAEELGYAHLDTGALYRAVALRVLDAGADPNDAAAAAAAAAGITQTDLADPRIREDATANVASQVSAHPQVRAALLDLQRDFAAHPPGGAKGAVIEGRDIGTVVWPQAERKIFLDASVEIRAERRFQELQDRGAMVTRKEVLEDLRRRDEADRNRAVSPLVPAPDAYLLDTSNLDIDSASAAAKAYVLGSVGLPCAEDGPR